MAPKLRATASSFWRKGTLVLAVFGIAASISVIMPGAAGASGPDNDSFAAPVPLVPAVGGSKGPIANTDAELEAGEPQIGFGHSLWYSWTAPADGSIPKLILDTYGSDCVSANPACTGFGAFDTMLAVYEGNDVGNLTQVAYNDDCPSQTGGATLRSSCLVFAAEAGHVYYVQVDDGMYWNGAGSWGNIFVNWRTPPVPASFTGPGGSPSPDLATDPNCTPTPTNSCLVSSTSTPTFYFHDHENDFICSGDGGGAFYQPNCVSPYVTPALTDGPHTFSVQTVDHSTGIPGDATTIDFTVRTAPTDTTPPVITPNVTGPLGPNGWYTGDISVSWTVTDDESGITSQHGCDSASVTTDTTGMTFTCTATSAGGTHDESVTIKRDAIAPAMASHVDVSAAATSSAGAVVNYDSPLAADAIDLHPIVSCTPPSGSTFHLGDNLVTCTATDNAGNHSASTFTIAVRDTTGPTLGGHGDVPAEATSSAGAVVNYDPPLANDAIDPHPTVSCDPPSGSTFHLGDNLVTCTATDNAGNHSASTFTVTVRDTTGPTLGGHGDVPAEATSSAGAVVNYNAPVAGDAVDPHPFVVCAPPSGGTYPLGDTTVTCTAFDSAGNHSSPVSFKIKVRDTRAPIVTITGQPLAPTGSPDATLTITADESPVILSCTLDGQPVDCHSGSPYTGLGIGMHTFAVAATDLAGNSGVASVTWEIIPSAGCNVVADVHGNANFSTTIGSKKATVHVEVEADCDQIKGKDEDDEDDHAVSDRVTHDGIYLHHSRVKVELSGGGDNKLIDAKQKSNNSKYDDIKNVQLTKTPAGATIRGIYNGSTFVVTLTDGGKGKGATDSLQVSYPGFPTGTLAAPHQDVHIEWK